MGATFGAGCPLCGPEPLPRILNRCRVAPVLVRWAQTTFVALENRNFRLLFFGTLFAQLTFGMKNVIQGIVAYDLTGKNGSVGLVALGTGVTMVTFGPLGGALGDRLSKRKLLLISQTIIGVNYAFVAILILTGTITIWLLVLSTLFLGSMFAVMGPTRQAWIGELLSGPSLANGIALQQIAMNGTRVAGPFLVGAMVAVSFIGSGGTYIFMATMFAGVVGMLYIMPSTKPSAPSGRSVFGDLLEGGRYIWRTPELRLLTTLFVGTVMTGFSYQTLLPGFLDHALDRPKSDLGFLYGAAAIGGLVVTLFLAGNTARATRSLMYVVGSLLGVAIFALAFAPNVLMTLIAMFAVGAFSSAFQLLNNVNLMRACSQEFYGRVMSVTMMSFGVMSIVSFPIGLVADRIGERSTLVGCGCGVLLVIGTGVLAARRVRPEMRAPAGVLEERSPVPTR